MPIVCDFVKILGDKVQNIGDHTTPHGLFTGGPNPWTAHFTTPGRRDDKDGFLIFNVRGLTFTEHEVDVELNKKVIGRISPLLVAGYAQLTPALHSGLTKCWFTQMIAIAGSTLNDPGDNEIQIYPVHYEGGPGQDISDWFDDFELKDMFLFFKQST